MTAMIDGPRREAVSGETKRLVVLLHGYGADGGDLFGLAEPLSQVLPDAAFVAPNAPEPCRVNPAGYQWFPIPRMDGSDVADAQKSFDASRAALHAFLTEELVRWGLDESAAALVGFSQGTMMSLEVAPRRATAFAGVVGFSGRLLEAERLEEEVRVRPPVLLVHGDADDVVPFSSLDEARRGLAAVDIPLRWHVSRGIGHGIAPDGLQTAASFLVEALR